MYSIKLVERGEPGWSYEPKFAQFLPLCFAQGIMPPGTEYLDDLLKESAPAPLSRQFIDPLAHPEKLASRDNSLSTSWRRSLDVGPNGSAKRCV